MGGTNSSNGGGVATSSGGTNGGGSNGGGASGNARGGNGGANNGGANNGGANNGGANNGGVGPSGNGNGNGRGGASAGGGGGSNASAGKANGGGSTAGGAGGNTAAGGAGNGGGAAGNGGATSGLALPCDVLKQGGQACVAAHSTVRSLLAAYTGPLYQLCKGTAAAGPSSCKGTTQDIAAVNGYADTAAHEAFCAGGSGACTITKIYDQSGQGNHLEPAPRGGAKSTADSPANANDLKISIGGHTAYGIFIKPGMGYRAGCSACTLKTAKGTAVGDEAETQYMVSSQKNLVNGCCFDYGNAETTSNDDGNGTMEAIYLGLGVIWGSGVQGGPWVMADLENGLFAGWEKNQDQNISTNTPLKYDFVNAIVVGDTRDKNSGKGRFALYGGDAANGTLKTMYDGIRPAKTGYVPMKKQGSIVLGIGGDNSGSGGGHFYEGVMANGAATKETLDALQAGIVAARSGK